MAAHAKIGQTLHLQKPAELSKRVRFKICSEIIPAIQLFGRALKTCECRNFFGILLL